MHLYLKVHFQPLTKHLLHTYLPHQTLSLPPISTLSDVSVLIIAMISFFLMRGQLWSNAGPLHIIGPPLRNCLTPPLRSSILSLPLSLSLSCLKSYIFPGAEMHRRAPLFGLCRCYINIYIEYIDS